MKIGPAVRPWRRIEKKGTGQDSQKKSQSGNTSSIWGKAPTVPIETKIYVLCNFPNTITCAKFQNEIFRGYDFTGGRKWPFMSFLNNFLNFDLENDLEIKNAELHPFTNFSSSYD